MLVDVLDKRSITEHVKLRLMLADLYIKAKQKDKAVAQLKDVSESTMNAQIHNYLQTMYAQLGRADLVAVEAKWMKDHPQPVAPSAMPTAPGTAPQKPTAKYMPSASLNRSTMGTPSGVIG